MVSLVSRAPCADILPIEVGAMTLTEVPIDVLMSVAPFRGKAKAVGAALKAQVGSVLPAVNRRSGVVTWFGHGVWMVSNAVACDGLAAVTDQSDAWAVLVLDGVGAEDVLARLVPVDLRAAQFKKHHVAKTMLGHMSVTLTRVGPDAFEVMVMRSMAKTLVHEISVAMHGVTAR